MQQMPMCFKCVQPVDGYDQMVFEAPCGHDGCRSVVFHGICLMKWREYREEIMKNTPPAYLLIFDPQKYGRF